MDSLCFGRATDLPRPGSSVPPPWPDPGPLLGTWVNFYEGSGGLVKLDIARRGREMTVRAWGADAPEPREWPEIVGLPFAGDVESGAAVGFTALYELGFLETRLAAYLNIRLLVVDTYNRFLDGSARSSYFKRDHYYQP